VTTVETKYSAWYGNRKIIISGADLHQTTAVLYDLDGRKLGEYSRLSGNRYEIPAEGLITGVYLLRISSIHGNQVIKVPVVTQN
jgi:hypothetical protein